MLDVAVSLQFARDRNVFWTYTKPVRGGAVTAAGRGTLNADGTIMDARDIFVQTRASNAGQHFGSRTVPMPDGRVVGEERLLRDVGRVHDLVQAEDGALLVIVDSGEVLRVVPQ
jgi:glucose/arabinose dehydrogenase